MLKKDLRFMKMKRKKLIKRYNSETGRDRKMTGRELLAVDRIINRNKR